MVTTKKILHLFLLFTLIFISGCETEDEDSDSGNGGGGGGISGTIWRGSSDTTTYLKFYSSTVEKCLNGNVVATGTYNSSAMTFVVPGGGGVSLTFPLEFHSDYLIVGVPSGYESYYDPEDYFPTSSYPCGGSGSGSGGGGSTTGNAMFWTQSDLGCGQITVTVSGQSGTIGSYYSSGAPNCGANGCANFTLPPGTYNFSASCQNYSWNSTITVTAGNCSKMRLYL